jgi:hypothetical protein
MRAIDRSPCSTSTRVRRRRSSGVKTTIAAAGNTLVPAYLALRAKGYVVRREGPISADSEESWSAEDAHRRFIADDTVALLGLVALFETRGEGWQASDEEIDRFLAEFVDRE